MQNVWSKVLYADSFTSINVRRALDDIPAPVYYASLLGVDHALHKLIHSEQLESTTIPALLPAPTSSVPKKVNAQGGRYGNALHAASSGGHDQKVQTLLDKGADANAQVGSYGNAPLEEKILELTLPGTLGTRKSTITIFRKSESKMRFVTTTRDDQNQYFHHEIEKDIISMEADRLIPTCATPGDASAMTNNVMLCSKQGQNPESYSLKDANFMSGF